MCEFLERVLAIVQVLPLVHRLTLLPERAFPEGEPMPFDDPMHAGSLEWWQACCLDWWKSKRSTGESGKQRGSRWRRSGASGTASGGRTRRRYRNPFYWMAPSVRSRPHVASIMPCGEQFRTLLVLLYDPYYVMVHWKQSERDVPDPRSSAFCSS